MPVPAILLVGAALAGVAALVANTHPKIRDDGIDDKTWLDIRTLVFYENHIDLALASLALKQKGFPLASRYCLEQANLIRVKRGLPPLPPPPSK